MKMQPGDIKHELFIGRCIGCGTVYMQHDHVTNSYGVSLTSCTGQETDQQLRTRIQQNNMPGVKDVVYQRLTCGGRVVQVDDPEVAEAAYRTGGVDAVLAMIEGSYQYTHSKGNMIRERR